MKFRAKGGSKLAIGVRTGKVSATIRAAGGRTGGKTMESRPKVAKRKRKARMGKGYVSLPENTCPVCGGEGVMFRGRDACEPCHERRVDDHWRRLAAERREGAK